MILNFCIFNNFTYQNLILNKYRWLHINTHQNLLRIDIPTACKYLETEEFGFYAWLLSHETKNNNLEGLSL